MTMILPAEPLTSSSQISCRDIDAALKELFPCVLRETRVNKGMTQSALVELAQMNRHVFSNLDTVTLSRWERGSTVPALYKQAEILSIMGEDLFFSFVDAMRTRGVLKESYSEVVDFENINRFPVLPYCPQEAINLSCYEVEGKCVDYHGDILNYIECHEEGNCDNLDAVFRSKGTKIFTATSESGTLLGHLIEVCSQSSDIWAYADGTVSISELLESNSKFMAHDRSHRLLISSYCGNNEVFKLIVGSAMLNFLSDKSPAARLTSRTGNEALIKTFKRMGVQPQGGGLTAQNGGRQCFSISRKEAVATRQILVLAIYAAINNPQA